jgi:hypothetical protein
MSMRHPFVAAVAIILAARTGGAQSLAERVAAAGDGPILFSFTSRPELCGDGEHFVRIGRSSYMGSSGNWRRECERGPVQVRITMRDGRAERVESWVGTPRARDGRSLGGVPAIEAARYLVALAARGDGSAAAKAIAPAVFADSAVVWPALVAIARDATGARSAARMEASFWLSRLAGAVVAGHRASLVDEDDDDGRDDVKVHAVFVLSQLPNREGIAPLLDVARSNAHAAVRRSALFWLGQSGDPRAVTLFESLLRS